MTALRTISAALLVIAMAGGCSADPYDDYCSVVEDKQKALSETLGEGGPDALLRALPTFRELQDAAPDDIRDDWRLVVDGLTALQKALDAAGVDPATYDREHPPEGVSTAEKDRIDAAAQALTGEASVAAFAAVDQQARDVCHSPLNL